jgi:predicted O-linked N-acetylglucosamine transferase (SPINDLY family)
MSQLQIEKDFRSALQHHQAGQLPQAEALYRKVLAQEPKHAGALHYLGIIAHQAGRIDIAVDLIGRAIAIKPDYAGAYNNLATALGQSGRLEEAIAACRHAIALAPNLAQAYCNLGNALREKSQFEEAIAACRKAIALESNYPEAYNNLGNALAGQGQVEEAMAAYRQAVALQPSYYQAHSNLLVTMHYHPGCDARTIAQEHAMWNRQHADPLARFIQPHSNDRSPDRRLRIGYVSPDFLDHPIGRFLLPLLANHDKSKVELFAYNPVIVSDAMTERLRTHIDCWRSIVGVSDAAAADLIRRDQIDVLVDLTMHWADHQLLVFARKPAPVQVTYLAYCSTTGLKTIDYRLSDAYMDPAGSDESIYSEETMRLPDSFWCYQPSNSAPPVGPLPALERGFITFGSLNNFCKVSEPTLSAWAKLLISVPKSVLLIHAQQGSHRQRIWDQYERDGIDRARVRFIDRVPFSEYLALFGTIDIALDTLPYGGGTTSCDALWMGVPVVSRAGKTAVGRGGLSILSNLGLPELVADSEEMYVRLAIELAQELPRLSKLRSTLRQRMEQSPLMDAPRFARNVERAYRQMWRTWCEKSV